MSEARGHVAAALCAHRVLRDLQEMPYSSAVTESSVLADRDLEVLGRIGTALVDPTRRRILGQLLHGPGYPAELADAFETTRTNVSNHLACLRGCGLVVGTAEGRRIRYELADQRLGRALRLLASLELRPCDL